MIQHPNNDKPRIVVVGAGFGGLFAVRALAGKNADITLIDRHNYHLFQPLLYQVAVAGLAPSDIAWPIRSILNRQSNTTVVLGDVVDIDTEHQEVVTADSRFSYDYLIIATGATHSYFGNDSWAATAPGLKSIDDATAIRRRILLAFERAEMSADIAERARLLQFVIVGGGPTGVELAGTIAELAHHTLAKDFRRIDPRSANILLIEAGPRLLPAFSERASEYTRRTLQKLGVEVRLNLRVTHCGDYGVTIEPERVNAGTVLWAAGVAASPVGRWLAVSADRQGRVLVRDDLSVPGLSNVFVIGDAASVKDASGLQVPGIAPAAKQQGRYVARLIGEHIAGQIHVVPFRYRHAGNLATIGRKAAVIEYSTMCLRGLLAWWMWGIAHIYFLIGLPSPLVVSFRWIWEYVTYGRGARLITGTASEQSDRQ